MWSSAKRPRCWMTGRPKAIVLPVPVRDFPMMSRPVRTWSYVMACKDGGDVGARMGGKGVKNGRRMSARGRRTKQAVADSVGETLELDSPAIQAAYKACY